jgi:hypothetical protein
MTTHTVKHHDYVVSLYPAGSRRPADCLGDFFPSRQAAEAAGLAEVARVAAIDPDSRQPTLDWAVRFTIRKVSEW